MQATQTPLSGNEVALTGLIVCALIIPRGIWNLIQHFETMAHEGMHAIAGSLSGGKVAGIEMQRSGDGVTTVKNLRSTFAFYFVGYLGPSAFGLSAARLIKFGHIIVVLWVSLVLLGLLLVTLKPSFGYLTVPLAGGLIALVLRHTSRPEQIVTAYAITWFLLLSGVRTVVDHGVNAADAGQLTKNTSIPALVWFALWLAGTLIALAIGARWMLHPVADAPQT